MQHLYLSFRIISVTRFTFLLEKSLKMWNLPKNISLIVVITISSINGIVVRQENSLYGPFEAGADNIALWDLTGSAQLGGTFVRLTTDEPGKQGGIWNSFPVLGTDWELHMQFHIHGKGVSNSGNGLAIWYTKDILHTGPVFGSKDYFNGLGIFIETADDPLNPHKHSHPYISAVVNNGSQPYEHNEDGTVHQVGGCHVPVRNMEWPTKVAVSYIANVLTVFLDVQGQDQWMQCIKSEGVYLPTHSFFGISASTGDVYSDNHDIVYVTALDMNLPEKQPEDRSFIIPHAENVLVHPKPDEIQKTLEQLQHYGEKLKNLDGEQEQELKREVREESKIQTEKVKPKTEGVSPKSTSNMTKAVYILGSLVILYVAITVFKKYRAQRHERMQKRLF